LVRPAGKVDEVISGNKNEIKNRTIENRKIEALRKRRFQVYKKTRSCSVSGSRNEIAQLFDAVFKYRQ
jgi:hypothetical protein